MSYSSKLLVAAAVLGLVSSAIVSTNAFADHHEGHCAVKAASADECKKKHGEWNDGEHACHAKAANEADCKKKGGEWKAAGH